MALRSALFLFIVFLVPLGCNRAKAPGKASPDQNTQMEITPQLTMSPVRVQFFGETGLEWEMDAPEAKGVSRSDILSARNLTINLFEGGIKSTKITADEGFINSGTTIWAPGSMLPLNGGDMFLHGHVVVSSTEPARLTTDWINYRKSRGVIVSTAPVELIRGKTETKGNGLEATPDLRSVKIFNETLVIHGEEN